MSDEIPDYVYDHFEGQDVVVQFKGVYYTVTHPGVPYTVMKTVNPDLPYNLSKPPHEGNWEPEFLRMPVLIGTCHIVKDQRGNVRVEIRRADPNQQRNNQVIACIDPDEISSISMAEEESQIIGGQG